MPTVNITHTEINPSYAEGHGGGRRTITHTEISPDYVEGHGGSRRVFVVEDIPPILGLPTPVLTTNPASGIGQVSATLNGTLDDDGGIFCEVWFEWGLDTNYGTETSPESKSKGESFSFELHDLVPGTTYHFRTVGKNIFGMGYGADMEFTTDIQINRAHALSREEL